MLTLQWVKSAADTWLLLDNVELAGIDIGGVYIIWHAGNPPAVVHIGHGDVSMQLKIRRADLGILMFQKKGPLCVTWAAVPQEQRHGVVRYLADQYKPLIADSFGRAEPVAVNLVA